MNNVFLCIGTNLGNRDENLEIALSRIEEYIGPVINSSSIFETEPWGFHSKGDFLNIVVKAGTGLTPSGILRKIMVIESMAGRVRGRNRYSPRTIDVDILLYDDLIVNEEKLRIPHPLLHERKFVLVPLCEIASELIHPVLKKSFAELLEVCEDKGVVKKYSNPPLFGPTTPL